MMTGLLNSAPKFRSRIESCAEYLMRPLVSHGPECPVGSVNGKASRYVLRNSWFTARRFNLLSSIDHPLGASSGRAPKRLRGVPYFR